MAPRDRHGRRGSGFRSALGRYTALVGVAMAFTAASVIASTTSGAAPAGASPRPGVRVEHNLTYGTYDGHPLRLDVYLPPRPGRERAAALLIHGGGFWSGDKEDYRAQAEAFAREGYVG